MKMILTVLLLNLVTGIASADSNEFCGQAGRTLFNPENVTECMMTRNTCETRELLAAGWMPSANGKCALDKRSLVCGMGGPVMMHPRDASLQIQTLSTCDTHALQVMGWIIAR